MIEVSLSLLFGIELDKQEDLSHHHPPGELLQGQKLARRQVALSHREDSHLLSASLAKVPDQRVLGELNVTFLMRLVHVPDPQLDLLEGVVARGALGHLDASDAVDDLGKLYLEPLHSFVLGYEVVSG